MGYHKQTTDNLLVHFSLRICASPTPLRDGIGFTGFSFFPVALDMFDWIRLIRSTQTRNRRYRSARATRSQYHDNCSPFLWYSRNRQVAPQCRLQGNNRNFNPLGGHTRREVSPDWRAVLVGSWWSGRRPEKSFGDSSVVNYHEQAPFFLTSNRPLGHPLPWRKTCVERKPVCRVDTNAHRHAAYNREARKKSAKVIY